MQCLGFAQRDVETIRLWSIAPLLAYLESLPSQNAGRPLTLEEDNQAQLIMFSLCPNDRADLHGMIRHFTQDHIRIERTLGVWYCAACRLAESIEQTAPYEQNAAP